jgi:diketogulonate reductase-like aldo/keto reductase
METEAMSKEILLNSGWRMPMVGLGTFQLLDKQSLYNGIVEAGYRHLDTAWFYKNEGEIGEVLQEVFQKNPLIRR